MNKIFKNTEKLINDVSVQNATLEMFSKYKQNKLTKFIHVMISTEKIKNNVYITHFLNSGYFYRMLASNIFFDTIIPYLFLRYIIQHHNITIIPTNWF